MFASEIRKRRIERMRSSLWRWHLDETFVKINCDVHCLWRAIDHEGELSKSFVTETRDKKTALKFLKKAMRKHGKPEAIVTERLQCDGAAWKVIGAEAKQETDRLKCNRAENSHLPFRRRERAMLRFRRMRGLQKFASVINHFNLERSLSNRSQFKQNRRAALAEWHAFGVA